MSGFSGAIPLREGERIDSLCYDTLRVIQRRDAFRFGTDSVLLSDFAGVKPRSRVIDMGCGTGVIALLMASREPTARFTAIDIQPDMAEMAARSVALNAMTDRIDVRCLDLRGACAALGRGQYDLAVCNPPYGRVGGALLSQSEGTLLARHDAACTPDDLAASAFELLRSGGRLAVVFPSPRAFEMMDAMHRHRLAPKRIRTVHSRPGRAPKLCLIDAVKEGGAMLHWLPPLVLENADGTPTDEWKRIYRISPAE